MEIENTEYKKKIIGINVEKSGVSLTIDGSPVVAIMTYGSDRYITPLLPYRSFDNLIDLGKAVVREGCWSGTAHEGNSV